jgi:hypothetical protein
MGDEPPDIAPPLALGGAPPVPARVASGIGSMLAVGKGASPEHAAKIPSRSAGAARAAVRTKGGMS